jgi:hypothetical protein
VAAAAAVAAVALTLAGCFDVQESVSLRRDLSGKAGFSMTVDMEPMLQMMAEMQHGMSGHPGPVTPEEMAKVRRDFLAQQKTGAKEEAETAARKAQLSGQLPPGVKLLSASMENQDLKVVVRMEFGFDDIRKLARIDLPENAKAGAAGPGKNPYSQPFSGLKVTDEGSTLLVTMSGADPASRVANLSGQSGQGAVDPATQQQIAAAFKNARFAFALESPFEVVTTNATRRDGHTLYWEIKLSDAAAASAAAKMPDTLMARLKK